MLMCAVNHAKADLTEGASQSELSPAPFLREASPRSSACSEHTFGKAKLISPSEQVFRWIVSAQMKAVDFPLLRLFG